MLSVVWENIYIQGLQSILIKDNGVKVEEYMWEFIYCGLRLDYEGGALITKQLPPPSNSHFFFLTYKWYHLPPFLPPSLSSPHTHTHFPLTCILMLSCQILIT